MFDDGVRARRRRDERPRRVSLTAGPPGLVFGADSYGAHSSCYGPRRRGWRSDAELQCASRLLERHRLRRRPGVHATTGDVRRRLESRPRRTGRRRPLRSGPVALRDPMTLMMLTTTSGSRSRSRRGPTSASSSTGMLTRARTGAGSRQRRARQQRVPGTWSTRAAMRWRSSSATTPSYTANTRAGDHARSRVRHADRRQRAAGGGTGGARRNRRRGDGRSARSLPRMLVHHHPGLRPSTWPPTRRRNLIYIASDATVAVAPELDRHRGRDGRGGGVARSGRQRPASAGAVRRRLGAVGRPRRRATGAADDAGHDARPGPRLFAADAADHRRAGRRRIALVVLPGTQSSIAVGVYGATRLGGRGVFILDDGQPRANFIQPPEVGVSFLTNGPPGYLLGVGDYDNLVAFRLGSVGATFESYGGLIRAAPSTGSLTARAMCTRARERSSTCAIPTIRC